MINLAALGGIMLFIAACVYALCVACYKTGERDGVEKYKQATAERRSLRRMEARTTAYTARHQAAPWPGPDPDQLASTDTLRKLAEDGNIAELERTNAAFMRIFDLISWTRKRETAS